VGVVWRSVSLGRLSRYTRKLKLDKDRIRGLGLPRHAAWVGFLKAKLFKTQPLVSPKPSVISNQPTRLYHQIIET